MGGREGCPLVADWNCPVADTNLPMRGGRHRSLLSAQRFDSFPVQGLGQSHGVSAGLAEVCVVEQPVGGGGRERFGHELVEPRWGARTPPKWLNANTCPCRKASRPCVVKST